MRRHSNSWPMMSAPRNSILVAIAVAMASLFASCSSSDDDFKYAQMVAEMCDAYSSPAKSLVYAVADDDRRIDFESSLPASWATKSDTLYRAILYYNKVEGSTKVRPLTAERVFVLNPVPLSESQAKDERDPLALRAAWYAKNGKYLNLQLAVKAGAVDDDATRQTLGMVCDTIMRSAAGDRYYYRIVHNQNGVPAFYSVDVYASVPTSQLQKGDTLTLTVPTWEGVQNKNYIKQ